MATLFRAGGESRPRPEPTDPPVQRASIGALLTPEDQALVELLRLLARMDYDFVTVTPDTHRRVVARRPRGADLRDLLGWSLPTPRGAVPPDIAELLLAAGALATKGDMLRSRFRVSRVESRLFLHSAYPTDQPDSVFLGPDSYRFVRFVKAQLAEGAPARHLVDMGTGAGVGALCAAPVLPGAELTLVDSNPLALRLARVNAAAKGTAVRLRQKLPAAFDLYIANPPFIADHAGRAYRHGGGMLGAELSLSWALEAARRIAPEGRILLYTGSAIQAGKDALREALERQLPSLGCTLRYEELDPDIFGEELEKPAYREVERIAAVGAIISRAER